MSKHGITHGAFLTRIGKQTIVDHFGLSPQETWNWWNRRIPSAYRPEIARLADEREVPVPDDFLAPPKRATAA